MAADWTGMAAIPIARLVTITAIVARLRLVMPPRLTVIPRPASLADPGHSPTVPRRVPPGRHRYAVETRATALTLIGITMALAASLIGDAGNVSFYNVRKQPLLCGMAPLR